ncbi:MAG: DUF2971 domain-containing protein [Fimbriimonadaceae bacterium]|nr:DUF2971 domain-containing protein [Fimbriimonadaceae bacterium]
MDLIQHATQLLSDQGLRGHQDAPDVLWHVTDAKAARDILESGEIWMSDLTSMDDPEEIALGAKLLRDKWPRPERAGDHATVVFETLDTVLHRAIVGLRGLKCLSMTARLENALLWATYGARGRGCALGIDRKYFEDLGGTISRARYSVQDQDDLLDRFKGIYCALMLRLPKCSVDTDWSGRALSNLSLDVLSRIKHFAYESEREWRLVLDRDDSQCQQRGSKCVFVLSFDASKAIREVVIGPCGDKAANIERWRGHREELGLSYDVRSVDFSMRGAGTPP